MGGRPGPGAGTGASWQETSGALLGFAVLAWVLYSPALDGAFLSDDAHYVETNPYVHELDIGAIADPTGPLVRIVENYAPVHLILHGLVWQVAGPEVRIHHVVNVLLHALASALLFLLLARFGVPNRAALLGALLFCVHPGNVEAVAWISQLKTSSALVLLVSALLAHPRRPGLGLVLFAAALLAKPTAAVGFFVVVALGLSERAGAAAGDWRWRWIAGWGVALAVFAVFEFLAFFQTAGTHLVQVPELDARFRTIFAVGLRYLVMAVSGTGLGAFQDPPAADSWLDPWWLVSLPVLGVLGWRVIGCLRARRSEAAFWVWAAVSFAPISGIIPLPHIIADRYLYFILPGLIGGVLLAGTAMVDRLPANGTVARVLPSLALGVVVLWIGGFAVFANARAAVWQDLSTLTADSMRRSPDGRWARVERAGRAADRGDAATAVAELRAARAMGLDKIDVFLSDRFQSVRGTPEFGLLLAEVARGWIDRISGFENPNQSDLMVLTQAYIMIGDLDGAEESIKRAIRAGGPRTDYLVLGLDELKTMKRAQQGR